MGPAFVKVFLLLRLGTFAVRFLGDLECFGRVLERLPGMLLSRCVIALLMMRGSGAVRMGGFVVEFGGSSV